MMATAPTAVISNETVGESFTRLVLGALPKKLRS